MPSCQPTPANMHAHACTHTGTHSSCQTACPQSICRYNNCRAGRPLARLRSSAARHCNCLDPANLLPHHMAIAGKRGPFDVQNQTAMHTEKQGQQGRSRHNHALPSTGCGGSGGALQAPAGKVFSFCFFRADLTRAAPTSGSCPSAPLKCAIGSHVALV